MSFMQKFKDSMAVFNGDDLEEDYDDEETTSEKESKATSAKSSKKAKPHKASLEALLNAMQYSAGNQVQGDLASALKGDGMTPDLRKLVECLLDVYPKLVPDLAEGSDVSIKDGSKDYSLTYEFVGADGKKASKETSEVARNALAKGMSVADLKAIGLELKVKRLEKSTGRYMDASEKDIENVVSHIIEEAKSSTPKADKSADDKPGQKAS